MMASNETASILDELCAALDLLNNAPTELERARMTRRVREIQKRLRESDSDADDSAMPAPLKRQKGRCLVAFPNNYIAIDIETTGRDTHFDEIIEIAGVKYEEGMEIARYQSFVKPDRDIDFFITELTGITNEMVSDAPSIDVVLPLFRDFIGNSILVGHNANFDINFLYDRSVALGLPSLDNDFVDTLLLSRRLFKDLENHKLQTVAAFLAVETNPAHRALADCLCTAQCLQKMRAYADGIGGIPELKSTRYGQLAARITPENSSFNTDSPIFGKVFAFTGKLELFIREEAMQKVANAGGINGDGVTKKTNYLVLGTTDYCAALKGEKSAKYKKAEALAQRGQDIQIISEDTFLEMLSTSACENASSSSTTSPAVNNAQPVLQDRDEKEYLNGLLPEMVSVIEKCGGDKKFLSITSTNSATYMKGDSASVKLGNMIVFRVKLHGKSKYVSVPTSMSTLIPSDFPRVSEATAHKFVKIIVDFKHPIEHYKDFLLQVLSESMNRYPSEWSCCSRYMECSDARSCVNPDKNIALACSYRKTLNSGRIFYGKNRNI